jgi:hypothetical protein
MVVREEQAEEDKGAGEAADDKVHFHKLSLFGSSLSISKLDGLRLRHYWATKPKKVTE